MLRCSATSATKFRVPSGDLAIPEQQLDGNSRVDGIALGAAGTIGMKWSMFANYTYLDSEVVQRSPTWRSAAERSTSSRAIRCRIRQSIRRACGRPIRSPTRSRRLRRDVPRRVHVRPHRRDGGSLLHAGLPAASCDGDVRDQRRLALQLNVDNLTDEEYYERIRNNAANGWATPGAARSASQRDLEAVDASRRSPAPSRGASLESGPMLIQIPDVLTSAEVAEVRRSSIPRNG